LLIHELFNHHFLSFAQFVHLSIRMVQFRVFPVGTNITPQQCRSKMDFQPSQKQCVDVVVVEDALVCVVVSVADVVVVEDALVCVVVSVADAAVLRVVREKLLRSIGVVALWVILFPATNARLEFAIAIRFIEIRRRLNTRRFFLG